MNEIKSFQDLKIWQESHKLTLEIYDITKSYPKEEVNYIRKDKYYMIVTAKAYKCLNSTTSWGLYLDQR